MQGMRLLRPLPRFRLAHALPLSLSLMMACSGPPADETPEPDIFTSGRLLNIAHRGGGLLAPEETIEAYKNALEAGADMLEADLRMTSDGRVVLNHDNHVERTTDGKGTISKLTFEEIRALDAGYTFTLDGGETFPYRGKGLKIATLEEFLDAFPTTPLSVEIKDPGDAFVDTVVAMVIERDRLGDVVFASFIDDTLHRIRTLHPTAHTTLSGGEMIEFDLADVGYDAPARFFQAPKDAFLNPDINEVWLQRALDAGLVVHVWTINKREEMERLVDLGVHGIMTDNPELLEAVLVEKGIREGSASSR